MPDTIIAQATPPGSSAISVIRISGELTSSIAKAACKIEFPAPRRANLADYHTLSDDCIDQVILTYYQKEKSYTGEEILEICTHGNPLIVELIIKDLLERGCRIAEPGEFTRKAFLAGKIDLTQAESVAKIINSKSQAELKIANNNLRGKLSDKLIEQQNHMLDLKAKLEAYVDFPEDDIPQKDKQLLLGEIYNVQSAISKLIQSAEETKSFKGKVKALLIGPPNAGKSTIFNSLIGTERALVSEEAGTTRDYINEDLFLDDFIVEIIDAAGIHNGKGHLEVAGIDKALSLIPEVDLLICILDSSVPYPSEFFSLVKLNETKKVLLVENKTDLERALQWNDQPFENTISITATNEDDIKDLKKYIGDILREYFNYDPKHSLAIEARHVIHLKEIDESLHKSKSLLEHGEDFELVSFELEEGMIAIGNIIGAKDNEDVLDSLFNQFCIGK